MSIISTKPRSLYLFYHEDGLSVTYKGNGLHTLDYGTARMDDNIGKPFEIVVHPNPNQKTKIKKNHNDNVPVVSTPNDNSTASPCPYLRYFECKILRKEADTDTITIGLIPDHHNLNTVIGTYTNPLVMSTTVQKNNCTTTTNTIPIPPPNNHHHHHRRRLYSSFGYRCDGHKVGQIESPTYNFLSTSSSTLPSSTGTNNNNNTSHPPLTSTNNINQIYNVSTMIFGSEYEQGDTIGCGYNSVTREIFFTKNGKYTGTAFTFPDHSPLEGYLYPAVSLHAPQEQVICSFDNGCGMVPENAPYSFLFDTQEYYNTYLRKEKAKLLSSFIPSSSILTTIIADYCLHYGYSNTLQSLYQNFIHEENPFPSDSSLVVSSSTAESTDATAVQELLPWLKKDAYSTLLQSIVTNSSSDVRDVSTVESPASINVTSSLQSLSTLQIIPSSSSSVAANVSTFDTHNLFVSSPLLTPMIAANLPPLSPSLTPLPSLHPSKAWVSPLSLSSSSFAKHGLHSIGEEETKIPEHTITFTDTSSVHTSDTMPVFSTFSSPYFRSIHRNSPLHRQPLPFSTTTIPERNDEKEENVVVTDSSATNTLLEMINTPSSSSSVIAVLPKEPIESTVDISTVPKVTTSTPSLPPSPASIMVTPHLPLPTVDMFTSVPSSWLATDPTYRDIQIASGTGTLTLPSNDLFDSILPMNPTIKTMISTSRSSAVGTSMDNFFHQIRDKYRQHLPIGTSMDTRTMNKIPILQLRRNEGNDVGYNLSSFDAPSQNTTTTIASPMNEEGTITEPTTHSSSSTVPLLPHGTVGDRTNQESPSSETSTNTSSSTGNLPAETDTLEITIEHVDDTGRTIIEGIFNRSSTISRERIRLSSIRTAEPTIHSPDSTAPQQEHGIVSVSTSGPLFGDELHQIMTLAPSLLQPREEEEEEEEKQNDNDEPEEPQQQPGSISRSLFSGYTDIEIGEGIDTAETEIQGTTDISLLDIPSSATAPSLQSIQERSDVSVTEENPSSRKDIPSRFFSENEETKSENTIQPQSTEDTDTIEGILPNPMGKGTLVMVNSGLVRGIRDNLESNIHGTNASSIGDYSRSIFPRSNRTLSTGDRTLPLPVTMEIPLSLSNTVQIAAHNALLLCYGYGTHDRVNTTEERTVPFSFSGSTVSPFATGFVSPSCASYTTNSTTKRIRHHIPHTFHDLLSYTDILEANQSTLVHRSYIRTLLSGKEYDKAIEYVNTIVPSILKYPPHAALISLVLNCQRILSAIQVNDIIQAFKIMKEDISPYLDYHSDHHHHQTRDTVFRSSSSPFVSSTTTTINADKTPADAIHNGTCYARELHAVNIMMADSYSFRQCLSYVRCIVNILAYEMVNPSNRGTMNDNLPSLVNAYHHSTGIVLADIINSAILEWEYSRIASVRFHRKLVDHVYDDTQRTEVNLTHVKKERNVTLVIDRASNTVKFIDTTNNGDNNDGTVGSKRPRDALDNESSSRLTLNQGEGERSDNPPSNSSLSHDEYREHTDANANRSSTSTDTSIPTEINASSSTASSSSVTTEETTSSSLLSELMGLATIQRFLSGLSPQRVFDALIRSTSVPTESNVGFSTTTPSSSTDNCSTNSLSSITSTNHNIGGIALSDDALHLWLILRRLFHDPSLSKLSYQSITSSGNGLSSLSKVLNRVTYSAVIEQRIQRFVYQTIMHHPDEGAIQLIYSLINKLSESNFEQLMRTTTQTVPIMPNMDFFTSIETKNSSFFPQGSLIKRSIIHKNSKGDTQYFMDIYEKLSTLLSALYHKDSSTSSNVNTTDTRATLYAGSIYGDKKDDDDDNNSSGIIYYPPSFFYASSSNPSYGLRKDTGNTVDMKNSSSSVTGTTNTFLSTSSTSLIKRGSSSSSFRVASTLERIIRTIGTYYLPMNIANTHNRTYATREHESENIDPLKWWINLNHLLQVPDASDASEKKRGLG